uniref:Isochorismatase family protein n=1 Tax=Acidobacterium capsulatum TaxID=33075 RepID=A0A7V4XUL8_9BACT
MQNIVLDAKKTALVAIDLQNALMAVPGAPHAVVDVAARTRRIADALRAQGGLVVWVRVNLNDFLSLHVDEPPQFGGKDMPEELSQIAPAAGAQPTDIVITKRHWGAFAGTALEQELRVRGVETVILTGVATNVGVESTLRQGTGLGFAFVVPADACSALSEEEHRYSMEKVFGRLARVRTTDQVLEALA